MFHKIKKMIELMKEFKREAREAIAAYRELQELCKPDTDGGGLSAAEATQVLEDFGQVKDNLENIGKE